MIREDFFELWVYLAATPLAGLTMTLVAYVLGFALYTRAGLHPLANPVLIAVVVIVLCLRLGDVAYRTYFAGAQFVHFLLGTATVALAVPIYEGLSQLRGRIVPLFAALLSGGVVSIASAVGIARWLGADDAIVGGMYAKSVTAPIAMGIAERIHVSPTLTAVFAVTTGIVGAVLARFVLNLVGSKEWWQRGFALGVAAHGIGTARAFSLNGEAGTFASLGMGLHGILGAVLIPLLV